MATCTAPNTGEWDEDQYNIESIVATPAVTDFLSASSTPSPRSSVIQSLNLPQHSLPGSSQDHTYCATNPFSSSSFQKETHYSVTNPVQTTWESLEKSPVESDEETEDTTFGKSVALSLREIKSKKQKAIAKGEIMMIISNYLEDKF